MTRHSCVMKPLQFTIRLGDEAHLMQLIIKHMEHMGYAVVKDAEGHLCLHEEAMNEVLAFCEEFADCHAIDFKMNDTWHPFVKARMLLGSDWVDDIIQNKRMICYSQAIVDANKDVYGHEILARFLDPEGKIINPADVFQAAKERGRLYALDRLCRLSAVQYGQQLHGKIFINFIPKAIYTPTFCLQSAVRLAKQLGIAPARFIFEVVETEEMNDSRHLKEILSFFDKNGFQYALDDVGEGHSTASLLEEITPHYMKLDRQFADGIAHSTEKQNIAMFYLECSRAINAIPLAEGIERDEDFQYLKSIGYELFQGFYFSRPQQEPVFSISV